MKSVFSHDKLNATCGFEPFDQFYDMYILVPTFCTFSAPTPSPLSSYLDPIKFYLNKYNLI